MYTRALHDESAINQVSSQQGGEKGALSFRGVYDLACN